MLQILANYAVPGCLFLLMLVAGTEVNVADFSRLRHNFGVVAIGAAGPLAVLPVIVLFINSAAAPPPPVAVGMLLLSLCPNGGISNYYCYLARCNVLLSATITAIGTVLSLLTIPVWLELLSTFSSAATGLVTVPASTIVAQLIVFMVVPMSVGMLLKHAFPGRLSLTAKMLRIFSIMIVGLILVSAVATVTDQLSSLFASIASCALLFIASAMIFGWMLGYGLGARDRPVLVIESGVRNVAVALIIGGALLSKDGFGIFASFITGYFIVEIVVMLIYGRWVARGMEPLQSVSSMAA